MATKKLTDTSAKPASKTAAKSTAKSPTQTAANSAAKAPAKKSASPAKSAVSAPPAAEKKAPTHEEISHLAHQYWKERGHHHGSHEDDWHRAEQDLKSRS